MKVVKGSLWTIFGQVAPLAVGFVTTPFVIRLLGNEGYGVLALIILIPTYLAFADLGMSLASTKFASAAYAEADPRREAAVVRTAALIALSAALPFALVLFVFSGSIIGLFNVPERLMADAAVALRLSAITFVINVMNLVLNTPQLVRMRMDLNALINAGFRIVGQLAMPIVLYLGFGLVGAATVLLGAAVLTFAGHLAVSRRLLSELIHPTIDRASLRPMVRFGIGLALSGIAAGIIINLDKLVLARVANVETLAFYSVAFTFASMAGMWTAAMTQSLVPAFSQLLAPERRDFLNSLYTRSVRLNLFGLLPVVTVLFVMARPFFTIWAGPDYGRESTVPFYILLVGLLLNLNAHVAGALIVALGRTDAQAKVYWIGLLPYGAVVTVLASTFGAEGAALSWSIQVTATALVYNLMARRFGGISFRFIDHAWMIIGSMVILMPPVLAAWLRPEMLPLQVALLALSLAGYAAFLWKYLMESDERAWLVGRFGRFAGSRS